VPVIHASYYTDPTCPWSWALEPSRRRLEREFGDGIALRFVMAGRAREFAAPQEELHAWLDAADRVAMPVDPRLWLETPPASSYPSCLAVLAAAEQGDPGPYLRRLREGFAFGRRRLDHVEALVAEAQAVGLDVARFRIDLGSSAVVEAFGEDLERAHAAGPEGEPVALPTIVFTAQDGATHAVAGFAPYERWRDAALDAGAVPAGEPVPGVEDALRRWGSLATAEVAAVCDLPGPRAAAELWRLALEWRVRGDRHLTEAVWSVA